MWGDREKGEWEGVAFVRLTGCLRVNREKTSLKFECYCAADIRRLAPKCLSDSNLGVSLSALANFKIIICCGPSDSIACGWTSDCYIYKYQEIHYL